ncbi:MAG TPA: methyltransferase domain-containing protein [Thermoanaerobaculia bacterium]|nr:methyltransferase domain-containing protein [Thermoanaerobaculia bacterium]
MNVDLYSDDPRVVAMDVRRLEIPDAAADLVVAKDILEHFGHGETALVLTEWARVLKPGARLWVRCPSLRLQATAYVSGVWDADVASYMIFGGQANPGDFHRTGFDPDSIRRHLEAAGFEVVHLEEHDLPQTAGYINLNMTVEATKRPA